MEKRFFNIDQLTEYVMLSKSTIYKKVSNNEIPYIKIGKKVLFDKEQIDPWVLNGGIIPEELPTFKILN